MTIPNLLERLSRIRSRVTKPVLNALLGAAGLTTIGFFISGLAPVSGIAGLAIGLSGVGTMAFAFKERKALLNDRRTDAALFYGVMIVFLGAGTALIQGNHLFVVRIPAQHVGVEQLAGSEALNFLQPQIRLKGLNAERPEIIRVEAEELNLEAVANIQAVQVSVKFKIEDFSAKDDLESYWEWLNGRSLEEALGEESATTLTGLLENEIPVMELESSLRQELSQQFHSSPFGGSVSTET